MVGQLWIWRIDSNTLVTALPERWHEGPEMTLLDKIATHIAEWPPRRLEEMTEMIIEVATTFIDAPANSGFDTNVFDIFEESIAMMADKETRAYKTFYKQQETCARLNGKIRDRQPLTEGEREVLRKAEDDVCDILEETRYLEEIKDICDELKMIERVFEDQANFLTAYDSSTPWPQPVLELDIWVFRRRKLTMLRVEAEVVEQSLRTLLDLKQKQGNLNEARDTRKLADNAEQRALEGERQSQMIFIFTVVTVIYVMIAETRASRFLTDIPSDYLQVYCWPVAMRLRHYIHY
ncbi:unnamed protein product [Parascedosporium putredinis]|uniref:Uncharacterized protein n=1 Tax=Parascedosporium putredinis TaxID=1442378 RepID=A0A9P1MDU7_9PEZI|nr:unnamed protein product [Parascedosporium putredinis]CAI8003306.1 unnamed protein product [Parascedosporium putredinis]